MERIVETGRSSIGSNGLLTLAVAVDDPGVGAVRARRVARPDWPGVHTNTHMGVLGSEQELRTDGSNEDESTIPTMFVETA